MKGKPDIEAVDTTDRANTVSSIFEVTTKPMIYDGDTGGRKNILVLQSEHLNGRGLAIIIEDKTGLNKNNLFGTDVQHTLEPITEFCAKIRSGKNAQV